MINGLKQLTEMIFKPLYIQDEPDSFVEQQQQQQIRSQQQENSNDFLAFLNTTAAHSQQSNAEQFLDTAMKDAEKFCAMVITNLTSDEEKKMDKDWYTGQLNAYQSASQELFAKDETKVAVRNLREF